MLQEKSKDLVVNFAGKDSKIFNAMKSVYLPASLNPRQHDPCTRLTFGAE